jgi:hypothetical protein
MMPSKTEVIREDFANRGFSYLPGLKSKEWARYRQTQLKSIAPDELLKSDAPFKWNSPAFMLAHSQFWDLLLDTQILECVRASLESEDIRFADECDAKIWRKQIASGWHRDGLEQEFGKGTDWNETIGSYKLARVAVYLPDEADEFFWGCIPESHKNELRLSCNEEVQLRQQACQTEQSIPFRLGYIETIEGRLPIRVNASSSSLVAEEKWIKIAPGDILIFDPRLIHAGGNVRGTKFALFMSFGAMNFHTMAYALKSSTYSCSTINRDFGDFLAKNSLSLRNNFKQTIF